MEVRLDGRTAIITGASKGLGLAMAKEFAASGANVAILARSPDGLAEAKAVVSDGASGKVATFQCDVSKAEDITKTFDAVVKTFGKVDILINNAGTSRAMPSDTDHRRNLAGRSGPEAVCRDPPDPPRLAGDEGAEMGPHHQRAEPGRQGAEGERRTDRGVAGRRHGADEDPGE